MKASWPGMRFAHHIRIFTVALDLPDLQSRRVDFRGSASAQHGNQSNDPFYEVH